MLGGDAAVTTLLIMLTATARAATFEAGSICAGINASTPADQMLAGKHLRLLNMEWAPWFSATAAGTGYEGYDVDMLDAISQSLGVKRRLCSRLLVTAPSSCNLFVLQPIATVLSPPTRRLEPTSLLTYVLTYLLTYLRPYVLTSLLAYLLAYLLTCLLAYVLTSLSRRRLEPTSL